eukprot:5863664-Pyramimonas_sp.AAC.1
MVVVVGDFNIAASPPVPVDPSQFQDPGFGCQTWRGTQDAVWRSAVRPVWRSAAAGSYARVRAECHDEPHR